jgi:hypothetical protein
MLPVPRYPALLRGVEPAGDVPVRLTVGRSGEVQAIHVDTQFTVSPVGRELLAFTIQRALREARFAPGRRFGVAISGETELIYRFALMRTMEPLRADEVPGKADSLPVRCPASSSENVIVICASAYPARVRVLH